MREKRKQTAKNQYAQNHFLLQLQLLNFDVAGCHYRQRRKGIQQQIIAFVCRNNKNRNSNEKRSEDFLERRMQQQGFTGKRCKHRYQEKQSYGQINGKSPILIIIGKIIQFEINRRMRFTNSMMLVSSMMEKTEAMVPTEKRAIKGKTQFL